MLLSILLVGVSGDDGGGECVDDNDWGAAPKLFPITVDRAGDDDMCDGGGDRGGELTAPVRSREVVIFSQCQ